MGVWTRVYGGMTSVPAGTRQSVYERPDSYGSQLVPYRGKVILVINTASKCGFARQYEDLEALYQRYTAQGLVVLGFPSNDFLHQEPGSDQEIIAACRVNHGVTFPLMQKASVRGAAKQPLFHFLTEHGPKDLRGNVRWNFEKFLLNQSGHLVGRWRSYVSPMSKSITQAIEKVLGL